MLCSQGPAPLRHVILDRDGVLNEEAVGGYVLSPADWEWIPGVKKALALLSHAGIRISVATNQSCLGRGLLSEAELNGIHKKMKNEAGEQGGVFRGIYFCPHKPENGCRCRKPAPGLIETAIQESGIPRAETIFIGDADRDLQAAMAAGVIPCLVRTGKGLDTEAHLKNGTIKPIDPKCVCVFDDLLVACKAITAKGKHSA